MSDVVGKDMVVGLDYVLRVQGGQEVDSSDADDPLEYLHGHNNIIPGLENELTGLKVGDSKDVTVSPADGYGDFDEEAVGEYPRGSFPPDLNLQVGGMLEVRDPEGGSGLATVQEVDDDSVTLNFNHPLAGETLHFAVKVVSVREATQEELAHGHAHGAHGHH